VSKVEEIKVRLTAEEKDAIKKLAKYLHAAGKIDEPSISNAVRLSFRFTLNEVLKSLEAERYGGA